MTTIIIFSIFGILLFVLWWFELSRLSRKRREKIEKQAMRDERKNENIRNSWERMEAMYNPSKIATETILSHLSDAGDRLHQALNPPKDDAIWIKTANAEGKTYWVDIRKVAEEKRLKREQRLIEEVKTGEIDLCDLMFGPLPPDVKERVMKRMAEAFLGPNKQALGGVIKPENNMTKPMQNPRQINVIVPGYSYEIPTYLVTNDGIEDNTNRGKKGVVIDFCRGDKNNETTPERQEGVFVESLLEMVADRLRTVNVGELASRETATAITKIDEAIMWLGKRSADRNARGVEGTYQK